MTILKDVAAELWKMFVADARLTLAILALVALTALAATFSHLLAGLILILGMPAILLTIVTRAARR